MMGVGAHMGWSSLMILLVLGDVVSGVCQFAVGFLCMKAYFALVEEVVVLAGHLAGLLVDMAVAAVAVVVVDVVVVFVVVVVAIGGVVLVLVGVDAVVVVAVLDTCY
jgi:hypothetical protein